MSGDKGILAGLAIASLIDDGSKARAEREAEDANHRANLAQIAADGAQNTAVVLATGLAGLVEQRQGWRQYAARLRTHLEAHKMSESALMEALRQQNSNHPLATEEGFRAHFQQMLAQQYGELDEPFDKREEDRMWTQRKEGRSAVE